MKGKGEAMRSKDRKRERLLKKQAKADKRQKLSPPAPAGEG